MARLGLLLVVVAGCATTPVPPAPPVAGPIVYVVSHGWHVGLAVRRDDVPPALWPERADVAGRWLDLGWGDAGYYPVARGHPGLALKAAFASDGSVLHVAGFDPPVAEFFPESKVLAIPLSPRGVEELARFIEATYARDAAGRPIAAGRGLYGDARFYQATGRYRLLDNSNNWVARALAAAGCPIDPSEATTAGSVMDRALAFGYVVRAGRLWGNAPGGPRVACH